MKNQRQIIKNTITFCLTLVLSISMSFGQYTVNQIAGGATTPRVPDFQNPAHVDDAFNIGIPGPLAVAPNGDMAWADYWDGNLMYWNSETDVIEMLIPRGSAMTGIGGSIDNATNGDRIFGITFDSDNNIWYSNSNRVLKVDMSDRTLHHIAGNGQGGTPDFSLPMEEANLGAFGVVFNHDESILYVNILGASMVAALHLNTGEVEHIAGTGQQTDGIPAGPALLSNLRQPFGIDYVKDPNTDVEWLYLASQQKAVYAVNLNTGILFPFAGTGAWNQSGDGGLATDATLLQPHDIAVDREHNYVYFGDHQGNHHGIRRVSVKTGIIERYTGIQSSPDLGDWLADAYADPANRVGHRLEIPTDRAVGTALDNDGNLILGTRSPLLFKVDVETDQMELIAGYVAPPAPPAASGTPGVQATDMAMDAWGIIKKDDKVHYYDVATRQIITLEDDGTTTVLAGNGDSGFAFTDGVTTLSLADAQFNEVRYMIEDSNGYLYASDMRHHTVYKIDITSDEVTIVAGIGSNGFGEDENGGPATAARLNNPHGIAFNTDESLMYIVDQNNRRVRVVDMETGIIEVFAGTGGGNQTNEPTPLLEAELRDIRDVVVDSDDMVYVATTRGSKKIYKMDPVAEMVTVFSHPDNLSGIFSNPFGLFLDEAAGFLWLADNNNVKTIDFETGHVFNIAPDVPGAWDVIKDGNDVYVTGRGNGIFHINVDTPGALATIQGYADANDASELTLALLNEVGAETIEFNLDAYKTAVAEETAASLPTVESVITLVNEVNAEQAAAVIAAINGFAVANDASGLEIFHLVIVGINNIIDANLDAYRAAVASADGVADQAALQALINAGNANASLMLIHAMAVANDASDLSFTLIRAAGADSDNIRQNTFYNYMPHYKDGVEAATEINTQEELDAILIAANVAGEDAMVADALAAINAMAVAGDAGALTFAMLINAGANMDLLHLDFLMYYMEGVEDATGVANAAELDAIIEAANAAGVAAEAANALAMINQMAIDSDASELTRAMLVAAGAVNLKGDMPHFEAYQAHIEAAAGVADVVALQAIIDAANLELAILKIVAFAEADDASSMSGQDLVEAGVNPTLIVAVYMSAYREAVAASDGTDVDTTEKIEALVVATNESELQGAIAAIIAMSVAGDAEELTALLLQQAGMDFEEQYLEEYKIAIETSGALADAEEIQTLLTFVTNCETIKPLVGTEGALGITMEMLHILGIENVFEVIFNEGYYHEWLFEAEEVEDCGASIQLIIDATNFAFIQEMAEFEYAEDLTAEMLVAVGVVNVIPGLLEHYQEAIEGAGTIADLAELQALIDGVNADNLANVTLNVKMAVWAEQGKFDPAEDYVDVAGTFNDWGGEEIQLTAVDPVDEDLTYTVTINDLVAGTEYEFKFRINGSWEDDMHEFPSGGPARTITPDAGDSEYSFWFNDEEPVSVNDIAISNLLVYPNPAKETLNIVSDITINEVRVISSLGQIVFFDQIGATQTRLSVSDFDTGIYLVQVITIEGTQVHRVLINR